MNMKKYLKESKRTVAPGIHPDKVNARYIYRTLMGAILSLGHLDAVKKALFYGKDNLTWTHNSILDASSPSTDLKAVDTDTIHAILGIATEAGELVDELTKALGGNGEIDKKRLVDEAGDVLWYLAMLLRSLNTDFEEVANRNIEKLKIRFPEKFEASRAVDKNDDEESTVFDDIWDNQRPSVTEPQF